MKRGLKLLLAARNRPGNFKLDELVALAEAAGFVKTGGKGSHVKMERAGVPEKLILAAHGATAKPYQVRQVVAVIEKHHLIDEGKTQ